MPPWLIVLIISVIIQIALAPTPNVPKPSTLVDFDLPQADEGTPQAVVFGEVWIRGWMVLSFGNLRTTEITMDSGGSS